jgi:hypothetical protein
MMPSEAEESLYGQDNPSLEEDEQSLYDDEGSGQEDDLAGEDEPLVEDEEAYESDVVFRTMGERKKLAFFLSPKYCSSWKGADAFREHYQNW